MYKVLICITALVLACVIYPTTAGARIDCKNIVFGEQTKVQGKKGYRRSRGFQTALKACLENAEQTDPIMHARLGYMYRHGYGTHRDLNEAKEWYLKAAKVDSELAESALSMLRRDLPSTKTQPPPAPNTSSTIQSKLATPLESPVEKNAQASGLHCDLESPCVLDSTGLDFRVLPRVATRLYSAPDGVDTGRVVRAFTPWYVYGVQGNNASTGYAPAWYAVGQGINHFEGWFRAEEALEWRHALIAAYTIPTNRNQILMFKDFADLHSMIGHPIDVRKQHLNEVTMAINDGSTPSGIVSVEPEGYLDIEDQFYLLPIVDFKPLNKLHKHALALKLAAAVPNPANSADDFPATRGLRRRTEAAHPLCQKDSTPPSTAQQQQTQKPVNVDTVFVIDMTGSMAPYLNAVKVGIAEAITIMSEQDISTGFRYGLVGYRDNHKMIKEVKFTTKVFTKKPVKDRRLVQTLARQVKSIKRTEDDWAEEMYAGVLTALEDFQWRENAWRNIILIGDASSHEPGHPQSTVRLSAPEIRQLADELDVLILPVYLQNPQSGMDPALARPQFESLGRNKADTPIYKVMDIKSTDMAAELRRFTYEYWEALLYQTQATKIAPRFGDSIDPALCSAMKTASLINYIADNTVDDITFWAADFDLTQPGTMSLQARILVTQKQLDNLIIRLQKILQVMKRKSQSNSESAKELQKILYAATTGEDDMITSNDSELLPKWLKGLPYTSALQEISVREFIRKPAHFHSEQRDIIQRKIGYYSEKIRSSDWFILDPESNDTYTNQVVAIP